MVRLSEHQISEKTIQLCQKHHQEIIKQGEYLEKLAASFQNTSNLETATYLLIKELSQTIIRKINQGEHHLKKLKETRSIQDYIQLTTNHFEATQHYNSALRSLLNRIKQKHSFSD